MIDRYIHFLNTPNSKLGNNYMFDNEDYARIIMPEFERVVQREFEVGPNLREEKYPYVYCQTNEMYKSIWHNHINTSVINAVTYIDVPESGGELEVEYDGKHTVKVYEGYLYIFPGWMLHRPLPQTDTQWRICVNLEYICENVPWCKSRGIRW
jgi:hypothetical protein